jgi:hypothetical protein
MGFVVCSPLIRGFSEDWNAVVCPKDGITDSIQVISRLWIAFMRWVRRIAFNTRIFRTGMRLCAPIGAIRTQPIRRADACSGRAWGVNPISANLTKASARRMYFVPDGHCDRSLARSAWESPPQKSRPVGYGLTNAGMRTSIRGLQYWE